VPFPSDIGATHTLEQVGDRLAITDVLANHCRGIDRADADILMSCYWVDATVDYGSFVGNAHEFCKRLALSIRRHQLTQHLITNCIIAHEGMRARCETYVTAHHLREGGEDREMTYLGRYLDVLEKRDARWKLFHRQVVMDWNQNTPATAIWDDARFSKLRTRGANDRSDPLYAFMKED
jgi:ketosteroid isomerase-like protein